MSRSLSVMTYNIRLGVESSLAAVADVIAAAGTPDLLALQEVGDRWNMGERVDQARAIADRLALPHAVFAGALTDAAGGRYGVALCCRHPLDAVRIERLPRGEDEQRVMLAATMRGPDGPVAVINTHLSVAADERLRQARVIGAAAAEAARVGPVVVLGDLNDRPQTPVVEAARGPLIDAFAAAGRGPAETFSVRDPHRCIDYVFCGGGLAPEAATVQREARASDHFPLRATLGSGRRPADGPEFTARWGDDHR